MNTAKPRVTVNASAPARHRKAVIFCCDQTYLVYAAHAAHQIATLHPDRDFDICFAYGDRSIALPDGLAPFGFRTLHIDTGDLFHGLRLDRGKSHDVYLRLALPFALAEDYDRILYLDSDIFIQGGDFSALLDLDFAPHPIAAVRDNTQWRTPNRRPKQFKVLGLPGAPYFNAGVILMHVVRYNDQDLLAQCVALGKAHADKMIRHDQNLYNAVLQGGWAEISPTWNWQFSWASRLFAATCEPHLVHFIGPTKPWRDPTGQLSPRYANAMRRFAEIYFPDFIWPDTNQKPLPANSWKMRKILLKHLTSGSRIARYLRQFPNDLVVLT